MNIAIDVSPLKTGHSLRGTGSYTKLLIEALQRYEIKHTYHLFTRGQKLPANIDIVHYPYFDPFFLTLPLAKPRPVVVTVHDLIPLAYPEHFPRGLRGELKWQIQRLSLAQAKAIITDSRASKTDIASLAHIPQDKIYVIYLAPADVFRMINNKSQLSKVAKKYRLPAQFILYVGDVNWNKNLPGLFKAVAGLKDLKLTLVLVGKSFLLENLAEMRNLNKLIHDLNLQDQIKKLGFVSDSDLAALYNLASVYIQPSFAEGFGLPVLEAMACGCPVVCSKATSLREIAGPSILVDSNSTHEITEGIRKGLNINRQTWLRDASQWLTRFNWKRTASETVSIYKSIAHA